MSQRARTAILLVLCAVSVAHVAWFGTWVVEDAAISWAYAQNLANGLGPVPWPGAEPVEGYSNPTWVALLALGALVGLHPLWGSKLLAMVLTAWTVLLVDKLARKTLPGSPDVAGLTAAAAFAVHSQVGIFGAAALENPLFSFLLALGLLALIEEEESPRAPWSALWFTLLAMTRPDGIGYGVLAGVLTTLSRLRRGTDRVEISRWWLALLAPLLAYNFARWQYFGWELPATAYAKLRESRSHLWTWNSRGWQYLRDWTESTGQWLFAGLYAIGLTGTDRRSLAFALSTAAAGLAIYRLPDPDPAANMVRVLFPLAAGAVLWLVSLSRRDDARGLMLAMAMATAFFAVYAEGDWMKGGRWFAMGTVPCSVLLAAGIVEIADLVRHRAIRWARPVVAATLSLAFATSQVAYSHWFAEVLEISPWTVRQRMFRSQDLAKRLQIDERTRIFTVDMGSFLMFSGMEHNDVVGLTDMPIAQARFEPWFDDLLWEYIVLERQPHLIMLGHVEAQLHRVPGFDDRYAMGRYNAMIRSDLLFAEQWTGPAGRTVLFDGKTLVGWDAPAQPVLAGSELYLEWAVDDDDDRNAQWGAFLVDSEGAMVTSWRLPLDGPPEEDWPEDKVYLGRPVLSLPDDLPPGDYRIGFHMRTRDARNGASAPAPEGASISAPGEAWVIDGEVLFDAPITLADRATVESAATAERQRALELAAAGSCEDAQRQWFLARRHGLGDDWADPMRPEHDRALAACWLARALEDPAHFVDHLERARRLDPTVPGLQTEIDHEVARLLAAGDDARARRRHDEAYAAYRDVLRLDPYRTWARRYAEDARRARLSR